MSRTDPLRRNPRRLLLGAVAVVVVAAALALSAYATTPRTHGVAGDWQAKPLDGRVVGRVLLSGDHTALDLRTGKSVSLGSAAGGRAYAGDGRLVVAGTGRVDSVGLDGTGRWTWRPPPGLAAVPLAARRGSTLVAACPADASAPCDLVGLDAGGHEAWRTTGSGRVAVPEGQGLPHVYAAASGGGVVLVDPVDGRQGLVPGDQSTGVPDGPVVLSAVQDGRCVVAAYDGADPLWTRVLGACAAGPGPRVTSVTVAPGTLVVDGPDGGTGLDPATGREQTGSGRSAAVTGDVVARTAGLAVTRERHSTPLDPLRWGSPTTVLTVVDTGSGREVGQVASTGRLDLLLLDGDGLVVRTDDGVTRYTLPRR
ncbi:hypothetical protein ACFUC1_12315 [Pedococcus sp. NPDC057267]|uniref:hypothetical protein n=1 Tax=Pedococcus sp. NPDC057267 TaxID=3346077 RepID=UPI0036374983